MARPVPGPRKPWKRRGHGLPQPQALAGCRGRVGTGEAGSEASQAAGWERERPPTVTGCALPHLRAAARCYRHRHRFLLLLSAVALAPAASLRAAAAATAAAASSARCLRSARRHDVTAASKQAAEIRGTPEALPACLPACPPLLPAQPIAARSPASRERSPPSLPTAPPGAGGSTRGSCGSSGLRFPACTARLPRS